MIQLELANGHGPAIIDDQDGDLAEQRWHITAGGRYAANGRHEYLHMVVARRMFGTIPDGLEVDHASGNKLDCRRTNIRLGTRSQNNANAPARRDGYKGVCYVKRRARCGLSAWAARIKVDGTEEHLGYHETEVEAAGAYDEAALEHYGEFARLNFPEAA